MNPNPKNEETVNHHRRAPLTLPVALALVTIASVAVLRADNDEESGLTIAKLKGPWQAAIVYSNTGCGPASGLVNFTLDSTGSTHSATLVFHSGAGPGCGDSKSSQTFTIQTLNRNGSGTAGLSCGVGCGWEFNIQVDRHGTMFNLVDVDPNNPNNFVEGTAIRQFSPEHDDDR
jgi:hypothetical protein